MSSENSSKIVGQKPAIGGTSMLSLASRKTAVGQVTSEIPIDSDLGIPYCDEKRKSVSKKTGLKSVRSLKDFTHSGRNG